MKFISLIAIVIVLALTMTVMTGCAYYEGGMQIVDTTFKFDKAIIFLPNGESIEGKVDSWLDFENSDMIQVKIDKVTYLTHSSNVILISE